MSTGTRLGSEAGMMKVVWLCTRDPLVSWRHVVLLVPAGVKWVETYIWEGFLMMMMMIIIIIISIMIMMIIC